MIALADLSRVLEDLGAAVRDPFELVWRPAKGAERHHTFARAIEGAAWAEKLPPGELFVRPTGQLRVLTVGLAGVGADAFALELVGLLQVTGARPQVLGAGEAREVWIRHDLGAPGLLPPAVRRALTVAIGTLAGAVQVDQAPGQDGKARLTRVPGTLVAGDVVEVLVEGQGEASLQELARLARDLDPRGAAAAPPTNGNGEHTSLEDLLAELPEPTSYRWVGAIAAKDRHAGEVLAAAPPNARHLIEEGAESHIRGDPRPARRMDEARAKRIERAIRAIGKEPMRESLIPVRFLELVRSTTVLGLEVTFNAHIECEGRKAYVRRIDAATLAHYVRFRVAAMAAGLVLPVIASPSIPWGKLVADAMGRARTETRRQGTLSVAIQEEIRARVGELAKKPGDSADDLKVGRAVRLADGRIGVRGRDVVASVFLHMEMDRPKREQIRDAAIALHAELEERHALQDGTVVECWAFPCTFGPS